MTDRARGATKLTKGESDFLAHMISPWWNLINKSTWYVTFGTESGKFWHPKGPMGSIAASLMRKGLIDFAKKTGRIGKLVLTEKAEKAGQP